MVVIIIIIRDFVYLLHCIVLIEYPRSPPRIILVDCARSRRWILFLLPEADQILDLGRRALQGIVDMLSVSLWYLSRVHEWKKKKKHFPKPVR